MADKKEKIAASDESIWRSPGNFDYLKKRSFFLRRTGEEQKEPVGDRPILPRFGWKSQYSFLKAVLKAKRALEEAEKLNE